MKSSVCTTPLYKNEDFLRQKYEVEKLSARQIAVLISCSHDAINRALSTFGIRKRKIKSGYAPYGHKLHKNKVVPHVRQQKIIKQMQRLRKKGWSYKKIADRLNDCGVKTPTGKDKWYGCGVRRILKNTI